MDALEKQKFKEPMLVLKETIKKLKYLKVGFIAVVGLLFLIIAATPLLVYRGVSLFDRFLFEEDALEVVLIVVLFTLAYLVSRVYRVIVVSYHEKLLQLGAEKSLLTDRLTDAFRYIGTVNVQLQEIEAIFSKLRRLPENKIQFKQLLAIIGKNILGIVNADWILIRIVDRHILRTIVEDREYRCGCRISGDPHIGNRAIFDGKNVAGFVIVTGTKDNLPIVAACILPLDHLDKQESILIQALVDTVELLFIISKIYPAVKTGFSANGTVIGQRSLDGKTKADSVINYTYR